MRLRGGVSLVSRPPAFSADAKLLLVCTGFTVSVFSVSTGLLVNELEGHNGLVTSVNVVEYAGAAKYTISHVWTSSLDGTVRFWDFTTGSLIRTVHVGNPISSMVIPRFSTPESTAPYNESFCLLLVQHKKGTHDAFKDQKRSEENDAVREMNEVHNHEPSFRVVIHNLTTGKPLPGHLADISTPQILARSQPGGLVGIVDNRKIWVWRVSKEGISGIRSFQVTLLHHTKALHALAFDPTETLVAGSDSSGRVLIWKNVGERSYAVPIQGKEQDTDKKHKNGKQVDANRGVRGDDDAAAMSTYHWHSDQVNFLLFSLDSAFLFSGGKEAVFVMWQLETGKQRFLPRIGSSLLHCVGSSDASIFSVACEDNTIRLVNIGTMAVQKSIQGIKPSVPLSSKMRLFDLKRITLLPGSNNLVLPAGDMSLQFYDVVHDRQIGEVQVSLRNHISDNKKGSNALEKAQTSKASVSITHVVFSKDGSVMATAECRVGEDDIGRGSCLKFWKKRIAKADFCLSTRIDDPHGMEVSSLVYHPFMNLAVSCCIAGEFKVWVQDESGDSNKPSLGWRCRSVGSYRQKPMLCSDFSSDGTLLAVAAQDSITLWNPSSNGLVHVLARNSMQPVKLLRFIPSTQCLVAASGGEQPELAVWSLETLSICWSYHVDVKAIAVDPSNSHFAILGSSEKLFWKSGKRAGGAFITVFDVNSPVPEAIWNTQEVIESSIFWVSSMVFESEANEDAEKDTSKKSHLLFLNSSREYTIFDPFLEAGGSKVTHNKTFSKQEKEGLSAFQSVYGKAVSMQNVQENQNEGVKSIDSLPLGKLLNCPSHLISLKNIGHSYIQSLMEKRTGVA